MGNFIEYLNESAKMPKVVIAKGNVYRLYENNNPSGDIPIVKSEGDICVQFGYEEMEIDDLAKYAPNGVTICKTDAKPIDPRDHFKQFIAFGSRKDIFKFLNDSDLDRNYGYNRFLVSVRH